MAAPKERRDLSVEDEKALLTQGPAPSKRSTAYLDGLRGAAALMVFNGHFIGGGWHERAFGQIDDISPQRNWTFVSFPIIRLFYVAGPAAVSVFFVLSGFVITQSLLKHVRHDRHQEFVTSICSAMVRRPFRLYLPCFAFSAIIAMAIHLPYNIYPAMPWLTPLDNILLEGPRLVRELISFFWPFQRHGAAEAMYPYDLVLWTLPIELKGSFICYGLTALFAAAVYKFGNKATTHNSAIASLAILTAWFLEIGAYWQACFVFGFLLSIVYIFALDKPLMGYTTNASIAGGRKTLQLWTIVEYMLMLVGLLLMSVVQTSGNPQWAKMAPGYAWLDRFVPAAYAGSEYYRFWTSIGSMCFVYAVLRIPFLQRFFNTRPLQYLGKVSFMLYLVHLPIGYCFSDRIIRVFGHLSLGSNPEWWDSILWLPLWGFYGLNVRWVVMWGVVLSVNLVVSHFLTKHLDEPTVKLSKAISGMLGLNPPARTTTTAERLGTSHDPELSILPR